jgi:hypothetical protein
VLVPLTVSLGAVGAATAAAVTYGTALFLRMRYASKLVPGAFANPLALGAAPLAATAAAIAVGEATLFALPAGTGQWISLVTGAGAAFVAALGGLLIFSSAFRTEILVIAQKLRNRGD